MKNPLRVARRLICSGEKNIGVASYLAFVGLLPRVDQEVFLQVRQLGEALVTGLTFEGSLSAVDSKMNLRDRDNTCLGMFRYSKLRYQRQ